MIDGAEVIALTRYRAKGGPGEPLSEMKLTAGLGIEGDLHRDNDRQISLLSAKARRWMEAQTEKGLCFARFRENILIEGLPDDLETGGLLSIADAVLRITVQSKRCHDDCALFSKTREPCRLSVSAIFASVEQSGSIRIGDRCILRKQDSSGPHQLLKHCLRLAWRRRRGNDPHGTRG